MKYRVLFCALIILAGVAGAQAPASLIQVDYVQGPISGCQTHAGLSTFCYGTDGFCFSKAGAAYGPNLTVQQPAPVPTGFVKTVQGKAPDVNGNIQLSAVTTQTATTLIQ